jgi:hypothetical protein
MTAEHLAEEVGSPQEETDRERRGIPAPTILAMCDRLLGEVGRRRHMFAWLRVPGAASDEWLPVDAYYPRARLVVMCRPASGPHDGLYRELVPAHGLGLLTLDPDVLGDDPAVVEAALAAKIFDLEHVPRPASCDPDRGARRSGVETASDAPPSAWTPVKVERMAVAPAVEQGLGLVLGLALAAILIVEVYLGVVDVAFTAGRVMLGFAVALEACSRAIGTVAAARSGARGWACACAIGGAPFVAWFAFRHRSGRPEAEPALLAGLLACVAAVLAALAVLFGT